MTFKIVALHWRIIFILVCDRFQTKPKNGQLFKTRERWQLLNHFLMHTLKPLLRNEVTKQY